MDTLLISREVANALKVGHSVKEIALALGITKTEVLNMADNAKSRNYTHLEQDMNTVTTKTFDSQILAKAFSFEAQRAARNYLKAKDAALKARGAAQAGLVATAKEARASWSVMSGWLPGDFTLADVVNEYCGLGREWNASGKMVAEFAAANNVDQQLAADLVGRQMTVAQDYAQATRGIKFGQYINWLEDAAADCDGSAPANLEEIVIDSYNRAAARNQPGDGLLIREFAENMGISEILPTWAEALQKNMPTAEQALEARKRISNRASAAAAAEQEAEQHLVQQYGNF